MALYGGIEAGGTKFVCAVGTEPGAAGALVPGVTAPGVEVDGAGVGPVDPPMLSSTAVWRRWSSWMRGSS